VTIPLEGFAHECAQRCAREHDLSLPDLLALAAGYYLDDGGSDRAARALPRGPGQAGDRGGTGYDLELPASQWAALESEARAQSVELGTLLKHAVLYLVADLDSGRVAARIAS
jgi:hypothetical protein